MAKLKIPDVLSWGRYFSARNELDILESPQTRAARADDSSLNFDIGVQKMFVSSAKDRALVKTALTSIGLTVLGLIIYAVATTPR